VHVVYETCVEIDECVVDSESKTQEVDVGIEIEIIIVVETLKDVVEVDDGAVGRFVIVNYFIQCQRAGELNIGTGEHEIESVVGGEEGGVQQG